MEHLGEERAVHNMQLVSAMNQINYGSYPCGIDWNIDSYELFHRGKILRGEKALALLGFCVRINIFTGELHTELEFLKNDQTLRIVLSAYDRIRDLYIQKTWILRQKQFVWEGGPQAFQISGKPVKFREKFHFGLNFDIRCESTGSLHIHFCYFDQYQIHCIAARNTSIRSVNPFDLDTWCCTEKHAMLKCDSIQLIIDGNDYSLKNETGDAAGFALGYDWSGGYFPPQTQTLCAYFWQMPPRRPIVGGALLLMGHDSCSSESAIWTEQDMYSLPRLVPGFARSEQTPPNVRKNLLPDLEWNISAGEQLVLDFHPSAIGDVSRLVFPMTLGQRIYGVFSGVLKDRFGAAVSIQKAPGFIDYRRIEWHKG